MQTVPVQKIRKMDRSHMDPASGWPMRRHGKMTISYEEIPFQFHGLEKSFANIADLSLSNSALPDWNCTRCR